MNSGGGVPGEAYQDFSRGSHHTYGSRAGAPRTAETERVLARTERARFVVAMVLLVLLVVGGVLIAAL